MQEQIQMVKDFHKTFEIPYATQPAMPCKERIGLRDKLIIEECEELAYATTPVEALDAIVDSIYVLLGTAHEYGVAHLLSDAFAEVHRSNMSKLDDNLRPIYNADGKVVKGPNYRKPELEKLFVDPQPQLF